MPFEQGEQHAHRLVVAFGGVVNQTTDNDLLDRDMPGMAVFLKGDPGQQRLAQQGPDAL